MKDKTRILPGKKSKVILIASGKGGVGKSTITSLIAQKLAYLGKKVGIADIDLYGPSIPTIFSIHESPKIHDRKMLPIVKYGVKINSIGLISTPNKAIGWRGLMANKAVKELLTATMWGEDLDYLLIDSPPGTGDIHLTLLQNYNIDEVFMISTGDALSYVDVTRAADLYKTFSLEINTIIENNIVPYKNFTWFDKIKIILKNNCLFGGSDNSSNSITNPLIERLMSDYKIKNHFQIPFLQNLYIDSNKGKFLKQYFQFIKTNFN